MYCHQKVLPSTFITSETEKELTSIVNHGLIPGRVSLRAGRQAVFFTFVNPMDNQDDLRRNPMRLVRSKNRAIQKYLDTLSKYSILVQFEARSAKKTAIQSTRSNAVFLYDTLPAEFIEKAIRMKTKDQLYQRESVILRPRVVLKANSQSDSQDLSVQEARSSWESQQDAESYGETRSNNADYRVPGFSILTEKLQDARGQNNVTKLIEMFEKHQHKGKSLKDLSQKQEINRFSEKSQKLLDDMNQTEIFELCENFAKHQLS